MKKTLFIVLASLLLSQCQLFKKEEKPELPPETQEGKRTMGCRVDGEIWLPEYSSRPVFSGSEYSVIYEGSFYGMSLNADKKRESRVYFNVLNVPGTGTYELYKFISKEPSGFKLITKAYYNDNTGDFETDSLHTGMLTITKLDLQKAIISGTFYFDAYNKETGKVVKITEGRFDYPLGR
ncbi:MAG: hypothetical protein H7Y04_13465 [Verrucomicrobia bacterium]|nr:hypothetical protein [Cytophagales bacterium]